MSTPANKLRRMPWAVILVRCSSAAAIGDGVDHDGHRYQGDSDEQQPHVASRGKGIVQQHPHHQGQADSQRERHRQPGDLNGDDQQKIGRVKDDAASQGQQQMLGVSRGNGWEIRTASQGILEATLPSRIPMT